MREYEIMCLFSPDLEEDTLKEEVERVKSFVIDGEGEVTNVDVWGKRHLAYPINKKEEGNYVVFNFRFLPDRIEELKRRLSLLPSLLRFLILRTGE